MTLLHSVEIFICDCAQERVLTWASSSLRCQLGAPLDAGDSIAYVVTGGALVLTPDIEDLLILGVWFNTSDHPWISDADCARAASRALSCTVLADPGSEYPAGSGVWLEVSGSKERLVAFERQGPRDGDYVFVDGFDP